MGLKYILALRGRGDTSGHCVADNEITVIGPDERPVQPVKIEKFSEIRESMPQRFNQDLICVAYITYVYKLIYIYELYNLCRIYSQLFRFPYEIQEQFRTDMV